MLALRMLGLACAAATELTKAEALAAGGDVDPLSEGGIRGDSQST